MSHSPDAASVVIDLKQIPSGITSLGKTLLRQENKVRVPQLRSYVGAPKPGYEELFRPTLSGHNLRDRRGRHDCENEVAILRKKQTHPVGSDIFHDKVLVNEDSSC